MYQHVNQITNKLFLPKYFNFLICLYSTWGIVKATQYGLMARCKQLVEEGFDVRAPDKDNITLLHWAAINNRLDIARFDVELFH